jgi:hypothetical protein
MGWGGYAEAGGLYGGNDDAGLIEGGNGVGLEAGVKPGELRGVGVVRLATGWPPAQVVPLNPKAFATEQPAGVNARSAVPMIPAVTTVTATDAAIILAR